MTRLIVDVSSVVKRCLFGGKDEENGYRVEVDGKVHNINSAIYGYDLAINSTVMVLEALRLNPSNMILVVEGKNSKIRRTQIYPAYKESKSQRAPQWNEGFAKARDLYVEALRKVGALVVTQDSVEADDVIAYLVKRLKGKKVIFSEDGDLAQLLDDDTSQWRQGAMLHSNPYGPFPAKHILLYKSLVGDSSDNIKGATGFGEKAWLDMLVNYGDCLDALDDMIRRRDLDELADDVAFFKPFQKVLDSAQSVFTSYEVARLRDEWVNTERVPIRIEADDDVGPSEDVRLRKFKLRTSDSRGQVEEIVKNERAAYSAARVRKHAIFDTEIIGSKNPVFLACVKIKETGEKFAFWHHREGDMLKLRQMLERDDLTWVGFNSINFDGPVVSAAVYGLNPSQIKGVANAIIERNVKPWEVEDEFGFRRMTYDEIDLCEVAPGVRISLKAYAGRMGYKTMQDMPFEHTQDLSPSDLPKVEEYCFNDIGVTEALFDRLATEINLRRKMSEEYGVDLRSKSDAQVAEAVLRKELGIMGRVERKVPRTVRYTPPPFIKTDSEVILDLIARLKATEFKINPANGSPEAPDFLDTPIELGFGTYKVGIGGLHSTHDSKRFVASDDQRKISDFDVASYYPNIMLKAGIIPSFDDDAAMGQKFIEVYSEIYEKRIEAKRSGNKAVANSLKITLNGTFGKLGSVYSAFYSPELMLAVTITGQLNLLCLIHELEKITGVVVISANTDGIMVQYGTSKRERVLQAIAENAAMTGFEYEETPYSKVALKDVNNYVAITTDGKAKRKGLYASIRPEDNPLYLMKNPTANVCSSLVVEYLKSGTHPRDAIKNYTEVTDFVSIRGVKGGGIQPETEVEVDDWVLVKDLGTKDNEWVRPSWPDDRAPVKRKSRPAPVSEFRGGTPFGRIARWYMTTETLPPIVYCGSGNKVPKTEGAKVCMNLPDTLPPDLDYDWYVNEALSMLADMGVRLPD